MSNRISYITLATNNGKTYAADSAGNQLIQRRPYYPDQPSVSSSVVGHDVPEDEYAVVKPRKSSPPPEYTLVKKDSVDKPDVSTTSYNFGTEEINDDKGPVTDIDASDVTTAQINNSSRSSASIGGAGSGDDGVVNKAFDEESTGL